jgi:long-chain fatty acid transport protein
MIKVSTTCVVLASAPAFAAGFGVDTHDARAMAMASAMKAHVDDASAVFYNPAGLIMGRTLDIQVGDTLIIPSINYKSPSPVVSSNTESQVVPPPHAYVAYALNDDLSVGIGFFSPFGLVVPWPPDWQGRFQTIRTELKTYFINPSAAIRISDWLRVGGGLQIIRSTAQLSRALKFPTQEGKIELGGGGWAFGGNVGFMVDAIPRKLTFGATYRSGATYDINGNAHFSNIPPEFQGTIHDQPAKTTVHLPHVFGVGVAAWPIQNLRLAFDAEYNGWQSINNLTISFPQTPPTPPATLGPLDTFLLKNWKHTWNYHLGGEYTFNEQWRVRAGVILDPTPGPADTLTPDLPDTDRVNVSAGVGYRYYNFNFDVGYMLVIFTGMTSTAPAFPGYYNGTANLVGLTIGYRN